MIGTQGGPFSQASPFSLGGPFGGVILPSSGALTPLPITGGGGLTYTPAAGTYSISAELAFTIGTATGTTPDGSVEFFFRKNGVAGFGGTAGPVFMDSTIFSGYTVGVYGFSNSMTFNGTDTFSIVGRNNDADDTFSANIVNCGFYPRT